MLKPLSNISQAVKWWNTKLPWVKPPVLPVKYWAGSQGSLGFSLSLQQIGGRSFCLKCSENSVQSFHANTKPWNSSPTKLRTNPWLTYIKIGRVTLLKDIHLTYSHTELWFALHRNSHKAAFKYANLIIGTSRYHKNRINEGASAKSSPEQLSRNSIAMHPSKVKIKK